MNTEELAEIIAREGLSYALIHYIDIEKIEDAKMRVLCRQAKGLLIKIEKELEDLGDCGETVVL